MAATMESCSEYLFLFKYNMDSHIPSILFKKSNSVFKLMFDNNTKTIQWNKHNK